MKITTNGSGIFPCVRAIRSNHGTSLLPIQCAAEGTVTYRLLGRVSADAPWVEIRAEGSGDFLESFSWVPYVAVEVVSGDGAVSAWIGDR